MTQAKDAADATTGVIDVVDMQLGHIEETYGAPRSAVLHTVEQRLDELAN